MFAKHFLIASAMAVSACGQQSEELPPVPEEHFVENLPSVPEGQIAAMVACLSADTCQGQVEVREMEGGGIVRALLAPGTDGLIYGFFVTDQLQFGVSVSDGSNLIMVRDDDHDGRVDHIGGATEPTDASERPIGEDDPDFQGFQLLYFDTMRLTEQLVPEEAGENEVEPIRI